MKIQCNSYLGTEHNNKQRFAKSQKDVKCNEIARGHFQKSETARLPGTEFGMDKSLYGGYITRYWNWMNSYWIGSLSGRFSKSSFCDFWKLTFAISPHIFPFLQEQPFDFSDVLHKEYYSLSVSKLLILMLQWILVRVALKKIIISGMISFFDTRCILKLPSSINSLYLDGLACLCR